MALLLTVVCVNVAILVYARTATRQSEIAVRSALGASRARIVTQLFGEALVLSALGAVVALGASRGRLLWGIFVRAGVQLGAGVAVGAGLAAILNSWSGGEVLGAWSVVILPAVPLFAVRIGVLAAMMPARRALNIQPTAVLKED